MVSEVAWIQKQHCVCSFLLGFSHFPSLSSLNLWRERSEQMLQGNIILWTVVGSCTRWILCYSWDKITNLQNGSVFLSPRIYHLPKICFPNPIIEVNHWQIYVHWLVFQLFHCCPHSHPFETVAVTSKNYEKTNRSPNGRKWRSMFGQYVGPEMSSLNHWKDWIYRSSRNMHAWWWSSWSSS